MKDQLHSLRLPKKLKNKIRQASRLTKLDEPDLARLAVDQGVNTLLLALGDTGAAGKFHRLTVSGGAHCF